MCSNLVHGFVAGTADSDVGHRVLEGAAHVELQREVVNALKYLEKYIMYRTNSSTYYLKPIINTWK